MLDLLSSGLARALQREAGGEMMPISFRSRARNARLLRRVTATVVGAVLAVGSSAAADRGATCVPEHSVHCPCCQSSLATVHEATAHSSCCSAADSDHLGSRAGEINAGQSSGIGGVNHVPARRPRQHSRPRDLGPSGSPLVGAAAPASFVLNCAFLI